MPFQKGHKINLGRHHLEETRKKISKNSAKYWLGKHLSKETRKKLSKSNTGKKLPKEIIKKIIAGLTGRQVSLKTREKIRTALKGKFLTNNPSYSTIHKWLVKTFGRANRCENKECKYKNSRFEWSLLKGKKYERKRENFWMLCKGCHLKYDRKAKKDICL